MTDKLRAAMQQALEALEEMFHSNSTKVAVEKYNIAYNALREALDHSGEANEMVAEQVKQEDKDLVAQMNIDVGLKQKVYKALAEQAAQETMIYISSFELDDKPFRGVGSISPKTKLNFDMYLTEDNQNPMDNCFASTEELMLALGKSSEEVKRIHTNLENLTSTEQVEQRSDSEQMEPVAYVYEKDVAGIGMRKDVAFTKHVEVGTDLYAAPVRTKDLTDNEIADIRMSIVAYEPVEWGRVFARAVIAADREKNK